MQYQAQQEQLQREQAAAQQQQYFLQQQQLAQQQALMPQPTGYGSNNPFAPGFQSQPQQPPPMPSYNSFNQPSSSVDTSFLQGTQQQTASPVPASPARSPAPQRGPTKADTENARLASLLANGRSVLSPRFHNPPPSPCTNNL